MNIWRQKNLHPDIIKYKRTNLEDQRKHFKKIYDSLPPYKQAVFRYILDKNRKQKHRLHVVSPSPWPIYSAACAFLFVMGMVLWMHYYTAVPLICGFISLISAFFFWFRDIIREGVYMGYHTSIINSCLRFGFVLFLVSEVMFFFGFFWALFHFTLTPSIFSGGIWPPQGIVIYLLSENVNQPVSFNNDWLKAQIPLMIREHYDSSLVFDQTDLDELIFFSDWYNNVLLGSEPRAPQSSPDLHLPYSSWFFFTSKQIFGDPTIPWVTPSNIFINFYSYGVLINPYKIPLLNTSVLLTSGFILTVSHSYLRVEFFRACYRLLLTTIYFGLFFIFLQSTEYIFSGFSINDGSYGSIFYILTGFHGFHVIVGTIFLIVCAFRLRLSHFTANNHFAFEAAAWYWHFVDVVWILLYLLLYLWPNSFYFNNVPSIQFFNHDIYINMTVDCFFKNCNPRPGFSFPVDINFEYAYKKKAAVVGGILNHFSREMESYSRHGFSVFKKEDSILRERLISKIDC